MKKGILIAGFVFAAAAGLFLTVPRSLRAQTGCDATSLNGVFGYHLTGEVYDRQGYIYYLAASGSLNADGNGAFSGGDTLSLDGTVGKRKFTGTYTINADCTGSAQFNISDGAALGNGANYDILITDGGKQLNLIQTDTAFIFSGTAKKQ